MTSSERELEEIRDRLANDPQARARLVAGLGDALEAATPTEATRRGPIGELMSQANATEGPARAALLAKLADPDDDTLIWAPPKIARIVLEPRAGGSVLVVIG